jgi:hypothetical protein
MVQIVFFCYQGERNLTGWPHTILLGKPNSREPEVQIVNQQSASLLLQRSGDKH